MKIGYCTCDIAQMKRLYDIGYDFAEVNNTYLYGLSEEDFLPFETFAREHPGFIYSCNCMFPSDLRLTGEGFDLDKIRSFCKSSFARLARLGVKMLVFGSSGAKRVPEGFSFDIAMEQLTKAVKLFSSVASEYDMRVCVEPLRCSECNIINTAHDAARLVKLADCPNVGSHVDYFHMMQNGEKLSCLTDLAEVIIHTHIASPVTRGMPTFDDGADYGYFFEALRKGGYDGTVSFEGAGSDDPQVLNTMLCYLKGL